MSLNLYFWTKSKPHAMIDFPFQTPTVLTHAVMAEKDNTKRLKLINDYLVKTGWEQEDINIAMREVKRLMKNPSLELSYI